jgi:hypothetical protein
MLKTASDYRRTARQCRALALAMPSLAQREEMLRIARQWEALACDRSRFITLYPDLACATELREHREHLRRSAMI